MKIRNGFCYVTKAGQHRVVLKILEGKVWYASRGKIPVKVKHWNVAHAMSNPPSIDTFVNAVDRRLSPRPKDATKAARYWRGKVQQYLKNRHKYS